MKRITFLFALMLCLLATGFSQVPMAFKYQAVARDNSGAVIQNQQVGVQIMLLEGSITGIVVYAETHSVITNDYGLINLEIGNGVVASGNFTNIDWTSASYFIQVAIDLAGGVNYTVVGTSQLLSVPYALYAETSGDTYEGVPTYDQAAIDTIVAVNGDLVFNSTSGCLNYYSGSAWLEFCGETLCSPFPTTASAGPDTVLLNNTLTLLGNAAINGTGTWNIIAGPGGVFSDVANPNSSFTGYYNQNYILEWSITNSCGVSSDWVAVNFIDCDDNNPCTEDFYDPISGCYYDMLQPTLPVAGADIDHYSGFGDSVQLSANIPVVGNGEWILLSGTGGAFANQSSESTWFHGEANTSYQVAWKISYCAFTFLDTVMVNFFNCDDGDPCTEDVYDSINNSCLNPPVQVTLANAGADIYEYNDTITILAANEPQGSEYGYWTLESDSTGILVDSTLFNSEFIGDVSTVYELVWHIDDTNLCGNSTDTVLVEFFICDDGDLCTENIYDSITGLCSYPLKAITDAEVGDDLNVYGDTVVLNGNLPDTTFEIGTWIVAGILPAGGTATFNDIHDPEAVLYGEFGYEYFLKWTIESPCSAAPNSATLSVLLTACDDNENCTFDYIDSLNICHHDTLILTIADIVESDVVVAGGEAVLHANLPADTINSIGEWSVISGTGGSFSALHSDTTLFTGVQGEAYTIIWSISNACQTSVDTVTVQMINAGDIVCGYPFTDIRDQKIYSTVVVGDQCWMGENLNYGSVINTSVASTNDGIGEKYCYDNDTTNCESLGALYSWDELMNYAVNPSDEPNQGLCPVGWRVPTELDWSAMESYLDTTVNGPPDPDGFFGTTIKAQLVPGGSSGLAMILAGFHDSYYSYFAGSSSQGFYWTSTELSLGYPKYRKLKGSKNGIFRGELSKQYYKVSVRCVKSDVEPCNPGPEIADAGYDLLNVMGTSIALSANTPTTGDGLWTANNAGNFSNDTLPNALFTGTPGVMYTLFWTISNACGSNSDSIQVSFFDSASYVCGQPIIDARDMQSYTTIDINGQCWFNENLNFGQMVIGTLPQSDNDTIEKYCYDNDSAKCIEAGGLYQWNELMNYNGNPNGVCPDGWNVATDEDWYMLESYLDSSITSASLAGFRGDSIGNLLKVGGSSGFEMQLAGQLSGNLFDFHGLIGRYWTGTANNTNTAYERWLQPTAIPFGSGVARNTPTKTDGLSVRCIKGVGNPCSSPTSSDAGSDQQVQGSTSTTLGATPAIDGVGAWTIVSGNNGSIVTSGSPTSVFNGLFGVIYELEWTVTGACGVASDQVIIEFQDTVQALTACGDNFTDTRDDRIYGTVQIGTQCWMTSNMNYGSMVDGTTLQTDNSTVEKYCFNNDSSSCLINGGLYNWNEAMMYANQEGAPGVCPTGWHIPTDHDWFKLESTLDPSITDPAALGWRGQTAGLAMVNGILNLTLSGAWTPSAVSGIGFGGNYWTSTSDLSANPYYRYVETNKDSVLREPNIASFGFSIRCIKDDSTYCYPYPTNADAGLDQLNVTTFSVTMDANTPEFGTGSWSILSGVGGSFSALNNPTATFTGNAGETYILQWAIATDCDTSLSQLNVSIVGQGQFVCGDTLLDLRDGQNYPTLIIGDQCWFGESLNYGVMANAANPVSQDSVAQKYCYSDNPNMCNLFGGLYPWNELMDYEDFEGYKGLCPEGWHVPTNQDWNILGLSLDTSATGTSDTTLEWIGTDLGTKLKAGGSSGMDLQLSGYRYPAGAWEGGYWTGRYWSSTKRTANSVYQRLVQFDTPQVQRLADDIEFAQAVRCIKDDGNTPCYPPVSTAAAGDDQNVIDQVSTTLGADVPQYGTGVWSYVSGPTDYVIANSTSANSGFSGTLGNTYVLQWTVTNNCGVNSDLVEITFSSSVAFTCGTAFSDVRDGKTYNTVQVGTKCWMAENLNYGTFINTSDSSQSDNSIAEKFCYGNSTSNCNTHGGMYSWDEAMSYSTADSAQGICPDGWHIPSDTEWSEMEVTLDPSVVANGYQTFRGDSIGTLLIQGGNSGMNVLFSGYYAGSFYGLNATPESVNIWTSTQTAGNAAYKRFLESTNAGVYREDDFKAFAFYLRCIKD
jgi:uncharacterized protein (TIGR02145 family)